MRLLQRHDDGTITLTRDLIEAIPPYAILSHTWGDDDEEVVFKNIDENTNQFKNDCRHKTGYQKIEFCAKQAAADNLQYFWIDSCCIDKSSSSVLQEAITSMFRWYQDAAKCYVYLADVPRDERRPRSSPRPAWEYDFRKSRWFTRGWTLQELLAPRCVEFFSKDGHQLGSRPQLDQLLQEVTGIAIGALRGKRLSELSSSERMSWSRGRDTKKKEDKAYSLIGIFDVSMYINYGEGEEEAMKRLRAEIERRWGSQQTQESHLPFRQNENFVGELMPERHRLLMDSLSFEKINARHEDIKSAHGKTCAWLLSHPNYIGWSSPAEFSQHHGFLWIRGKPGAGKSTLMKYVYTRAQANTDTTISFFFNARGDVLEKSIQGMYRSLLFQLFKKLPDLQQVLDHAGHFDQERDGHYTWETDILQSLFSAALVKLGQRRVTCFVDALDECDELQVRDMIEFFEQLGRSAHEAEGKFYICFSSRHYPTIRVQYGRTLTLEDQPGHGQDLEKYVRSKLRAGKGRNLDQVIVDILQKADGVFMWIVLVVDILNKEFDRGRIFAVKKRLQEIPAKLGELFQDILRRDNDNMNDLLLCIQWILYAKRPLKPEEFYYALVAGLDSEQVSLPRDPGYITTDDINRYVSSSSKGLAEVTRSKAGTVQFIHESVRDFLLKDGGIRDLWPNLDADFESQSHNQLKDCCYTYIKTDISSYISFHQPLPKASSDQAKALRQQVSEKFPFLEYAIFQLLYHADTAAIQLSQSEFLRTFDLGSWLNLNNLFEKYENRRYTSSASLLYVFADNGLARLIQSLVQLDSRLEVYGERHKYPLFAALTNRHKEVVQLLLDKGADVESKDKSGRTPLSWAAENEYAAIVQLLLDKKADIESKDNSGRTPLSWAARNGHKEIVHLLLGKGGPISSRGTNLAGRRYRGLLGTGIKRSSSYCSRKGSSILHQA
ncbi:hypothetical protein F4808DRAFT_277961 [Astrocystis sublimbata]|nr:hypothetical protein F4808DRAFT_277961 [Astrocystis sublimbata]